MERARTTPIIALAAPLKAPHHAITGAQDRHPIAILPAGTMTAIQPVAKIATRAGIAPMSEKTPGILMETTSAIRVMITLDLPEDHMKEENHASRHHMDAHPDAQSQIKAITVLLAGAQIPGDVAMKRVIAARIRAIHAGKAGRKTSDEDRIGKMSRKTSTSRAIMNASPITRTAPRCQSGTSRACQMVAC
jgi:hypothetical protein